jgi:hypothetical protein
MVFAQAKGHGLLEPLAGLSKDAVGFGQPRRVIYVLHVTAWLMRI